MSHGKESTPPTRGGEIALAFTPLLWQAPEGITILPVPVKTSSGQKRPRMLPPESEVVSFLADVGVPHKARLGTVKEVSGPLVAPAHARGCRPLMKAAYGPMDCLELHRDFAKIARDKASEREAERFALRYGLLDNPNGAPILDGRGREIVVGGTPLRGEDLSRWRRESARVRAVLLLAYLVRGGPKARETLKSVVVWDPEDDSCTVNNPETGTILWSSGEPMSGLANVWRLLGALVRAPETLEAHLVWHYVHMTTNGELRKHQVAARLRPGAKPGAGSRLTFAPTTLLGAIWAHVALQLCFGRVPKLAKCKRPLCNVLIDTSLYRRSKLYCSPRCRWLAHGYRKTLQDRQE